MPKFDMTKKAREKAAQELLDARGWLKCFLPFLQEVTPAQAEEQVSVRMGNLNGAVEKIDKVLKRLGHTGGGRVR